MARTLIFAALFTWLLMGGDNPAKCQEVTLTQRKYLPPENIRFSFTASSSLKNPSHIKIKATLHNDNDYTVYFLTNTCYKESGHIIANPAKFTRPIMLHCNASFPLIEMIPPKGRLSFNIELQNLQNDRAIRLGFEFKRVDKKWEIKSIDNNVTEENIIWGDEQTIK